MQKGFLIAIIVVLIGVLGFFIGTNYVNAPEIEENDTEITGETEGTEETNTETETKETGENTPDEDEEENKICTLDAKICPDGTAVGRTGPNCEFAECPEAQVTECTPEQRDVDACTLVYDPVCANVTVECITTPCPPVQETRSNPCMACKDNGVISYVEGACN